MMTSLAAAMAMFFSAIPKIIGFAVILIVGWLLSSLVERGVSAILRRVKFNELAGRSGLGDFIAKMGTNTDSAGMIGLVVKWFIRLIAAVVAFDALGLPAVSEVLQQFLLWLPNVVVALIVLVIGGLAARALSNIVRAAAAEGGIGNANFLAKMASVLVWAFTIVVAVNQIGIASTLVNTLFMAFVGAIALGAGLAFGLGGRDTAGEMVRNWYGKAQENRGKLAHAAEASGDAAQRQMNQMAGRGGPTGGSSGGGSMGGGSTGGYGGGSTGGGYGGGSTGGGYGGGSTGGGYEPGRGSGGGTSPGGTAAGPRTGGGSTVPEGNDRMYPTPSSQRHGSEGG